ncbi:ATP-binding protein [Kouleothrix sp.]|uniref:ATP-binding protein n=1 Tax=Kouleothrix sp. TaxID=2779161 RepID=UPI00391C730E
MAAGESITTHNRFGIQTARRELLRAVAPLFALVYTWWLASMAPSPLLGLALIVYALVQLSLIFIRRRPRTTVFTSSMPTTAWMAVGIDLLFSIALISYASLLGSLVYPLYVLLIVRALSTFRRLPLALVLPFLFSPIYIYVKQLGMATPLSPLDPRADWGLLLGSLAIGTAAIWANSLQQRLNGALHQELRTERMGREARIGDLERSANDLRARMRQLHALEEGLRVITSTLSLDEVLNQIVDSTVQMLGAARVHGVVLSLQQSGDFDHRLFMLESRKGYDWAASLTRRAMRQEVPIIITDAALDAELAETIPEGMRSVLCVPLFVGDGPAEGALTVVSGTVSAFSSSDARHLTALSMQAGIAINNAELHNQLSQQQQLLKSVIRDINDGLVVVDVHSQVVITNPRGEALLDGSGDMQPIGERLIALAEQIRSEGKPTLMTEMQFKPSDDDAGRFFQAYASLVRYDESDEPLVAIVLHDITAQKLEERSRSEFISMVAHELRNPLNSLNGFIKVVLRGQAGALTALQNEFLTIADGQVELLKSRISEFLEYNRVEAGRLTLDPRWNDLSLLVAGTATRLSLQAEQNGLELVNAIDMNLPECIFDSERIGQVLNNLIENAIKATPPGGTITLRSELYANEVWIRVYDTGVGIPKEEQEKIFQRFYRAHNRASSKGNHLGLGLTICQQIVAGHNGRLWVESEEGHGSCFSFSLPLTPREMKLNQ